MKQIIPAVVVVMLLGAAFYWTMTPGNFWADSAAFATTNQILGLPHSPSFPLYTLLGRVTNTILPISPSLAGNILSAVFGAASGALVFLIIVHFFQTGTSGRWLKIISAASGALVACLSAPVWQSSIRAEVYTLQLFLSLACLFLFFKGVRARERNLRIKLFALAVLMQGLSFANHPLLALTTVPVVFFMPFYFLRRRGLLTTVKFTGLTLGLLVICATIYLYLPIRAGQDPAINSGQPKTLPATVESVLRLNDSVLPPTQTGPVDYKARLGNLMMFLFEQSGIILLLGFFFGWFVLWRRKRTESMAILIAVLGGFGLTVWSADFRLVNYDIVAYTALPLVLLLTVGMFGIYCLAIAYTKNSRLHNLAPVVMLLIVFFQFSGNLYSCDFSSTEGPDILAERLLDDAPQNALLIVNDDALLVPLWYHLFAEPQRTDVAVISAGAMYRPSYRGEIAKLYGDMNWPRDFLTAPSDSLGSIVAQIVMLNAPQRPVLIQFGTPGIAAEYLSPRGLLFRYTTGPHVFTGDFEGAHSILEAVRCQATDLMTDNVVGRLAFNNGVYYDRIGIPSLAFHFFDYAMTVDPENPDYLVKLGLALVNAGQIENGKALLEEAVNTGKGSQEAEQALARLAEKGNASEGI